MPSLINTKKHIPQQKYLAWNEQFPLFEPLTLNEKEIFQTDPQKFRQELSSIKLFPDPFLNLSFREPTTTPLESALIVSGNDEVNRKIAERLHDEIAEKYQVGLEIVTDDVELDFWTAARPIILIGGTQHNRWSRRLGQRLQLGVFNRDFPGAAGWGVTTYQGIQSGLGVRYILVGDANTGDAASEFFLKHAVIAGETPLLQWVHRVQLGPNAGLAVSNFDAWLAQRPQTLLPALNNQPDWNAQQPYREVFREVLSSMRDEPIIANSALLDVGLTAIRYYQLTGEARGLDLFREMMWGFWEYLNDDPNIYISDMDFRLGQICTAWSWIESHPAITEEERRIFPQLLLGAMRMVFDYYLQNWSTRQMPPGVCHNHQTFKARCLILGWRYFSQLQMPDAEAWKKVADDLFFSMDETRTKYAENANVYESFAPEHLLAWHEITGREISLDFQRAMAVFAQREWALTDNFFYRVEYGDCDVSFQKRPPFQVAPWLDADDPAFEEIRTLEESAVSIFAATIPAAIYSFGQLQKKADTVDLNKLMTGWTCIPLESKLQNQFSLQGPSKQWFDKLAWKSGWRDGASFLAIEGFGNRTVSHAHNAVNSVIRANFGGRVWLVGNGYGKRIGVAAAGLAWASRELGPVDHNMMIIRDANDLPLPPINAGLLDQGGSTLPFSITEVRDYGGCRWLRRALYSRGSGIDRDRFASRHRLRKIARRLFAGMEYLRRCNTR